MTIWGVGPKLALLSFAYSIIPIFLTSLYPEYFIISSVPPSVLNATGIMLLAIGIPLWAMSARTIVKGFKEGVLCTRGVYSIARHPLYSSFIVFIIPGVLMFCRSWASFSIPVAAYFIFKRLIGKEERYLAEKFGGEYEKYRSRVHQILPIPKSLKMHHMA